MARIEHSGARNRWPSPLTLLLLFCGIWLMLSPYLLGFAWHLSALWNALVVGICLVLLAGLRYGAAERFRQLRWTALLLGGWMIASPFVTEYFTVDAALWNALVIGALVLFSAIASGTVPARRRRA